MLRLFGRSVAFCLRKRKRWLDWLFLCLSGMAAAVLLFDVLHQSSEAVFSLVQSLPCWADFLVRALLVAGGLAVLYRFRAYHPGQLKRLGVLLRYPPTWLAGMVCGVLAPGLLLVWSGTFEYALTGVSLELALDAYGPVVVGATLLAVAYWLGKPMTLAPVHIEVRSGSLHAGASADSPTTQQLLDWLRTEGPIHNPNQNLYDVLPQARRFARLLGRRNPSSIALLGPHGTGKTSVLNLARHFLGGSSRQWEKQQKPAIVTLDAWGRSGEAAVRVVLWSIVENLWPVIDCSALLSVPARYTVSLRGAPGWWQFALGFLLGYPRCEDGLDRFGGLISTADLPVVLLVEDLDRDPVVIPDGQVVVTTLLDRLKLIDGLGFVVTVAEESFPADTIARLCDHVERVEPNRHERTVQCIWDLRKYWAEAYPEDIRTRSLEEATNEFAGVENETQWREGRQFVPFMPTRQGYPIDHVGVLLDTPRKLKLALRWVDTVFEELHGELDLDDIITVAALRFGAPSCYQLLNLNVSTFRRDGSGNALYGKKPSDEKKRLQEALQRQNTEHEKAGHVAAFDSVNRLIAFLFPAWDTTAVPSRSPAPQGVSTQEPVDYWQRLHAGELAQDEMGDQSVLRMLGEWNSTSDAEETNARSLLVRLASAGRLWRRFEHFAVGTLDQEDAYLLAEAAIAYHLEHPWRIDSQERQSPFIVAWRIGIRIGFEPDRHAQWVAEKLKQVTPVDLSLANDIYYYWSTPSQDLVKTYKGHGRVRDNFVKTLRDAFDGHPDRLRKALEGGEPYACWQAAVLWSEPKQGGTGYSPKDWQWFGGTMVEAAKQDPRLMLPQFSYFVAYVSRSEPEEGTEYDVNEKSVRTLLGDGYGVVMQLALEHPLDTTGMSEETTNRIEAMKKEARRWADENGAPPGGNGPGSHDAT